jgi:hypothetical protein
MRVYVLGFQTFLGKLDAFGGLHDSLKFITTILHKKISLPQIMKGFGFYHSIINFFQFNMIFQQMMYIPTRNNSMLN